MDTQLCGHAHEMPTINIIRNYIHGKKCFYYIKFAEKNNLPLLDKLNKCGLATEYLSELFPYLVFDENGRKKDTYNGLRVL